MAFGNVYLEHMRQARELTGLPVDGASGRSGCYAGLKARNAEVCRLLEQNNLFLQSEVLPFLAPGTPLDGARAGALSGFASSLAALNARQPADPLLCWKLHKRLGGCACCREIPCGQVRPCSPADIPVLSQADAILREYTGWDDARYGDTGDVSRLFAAFATRHAALEPTLGTDPECRRLLTQLYRDLARCLLRLPPNACSESSRSSLAAILSRFHEPEEGGIFFAQMSALVLSAIHPATYVHSLMVGQIAKALGMTLIEREPERLIGLCGCENAAQVRSRRVRIAHHMYQCGFYHDLGKLHCLELIDINYRSLFNGEFERIRLHPEAGGALLRRSPSTAIYADAALGHHAWYNGQGGYPGGFSRNACAQPVAVDITALADCLDSATDTAFLGHSQGKSLESFIEEARDGAGSRYVPYAVALLDDPAFCRELEALLARGREEAYRFACHRCREQLPASGSEGTKDAPRPAPPEEDFNEVFARLFSQFETSEAPCDTLRRLVLAHYADDRVRSEYIGRFCDIAARRGYLYSQAVGRAMAFWRDYISELPAAIRANDDGLRLIRGVPDYQHTEGYLSLLNNAILGGTITKDYPTAYRYALEGLSLVGKNESDLSFYYAMLNNTSMILTDVGLLNRARAQVEETLSAIDRLTEQNVVATRYRYAEILLALGEYDAAESIFLDMLPDRRREGKVDSWQIIPRLIVIAYRRKDAVGLDCWHLELERALERTPPEGIDEHSVTYAHALYHAWHGHYEAADGCFTKLLTSAQTAMLDQSAVLRAAAAFYEGFGRTDKSHPLYIQLDKLNRQSMQLADAITAVESEAVQQEASRQAYELLLKRMRQSAELTRKLVASESYEALYAALLDGLPPILPLDELALLLDNGVDSLNVLSSPGGGMRQIVRSHPLLKKLCTGDSPTVFAQPEIAAGMLSAQALRGGGSLMFVPLRARNGALNAMLLYSARPAAYNRGSREMMGSLGAGIIVSLESVERYTSALSRAQHDSLTGLANRDGIFAQAGELLTRLRFVPMGLCMIDIDDFKQVNDRFGHNTGDQVLRALASLLRKACPDGVAGRYGGEEFVAIFPSGDEKQLLDICERIRRECETLRFFDGQPAPVTVSIGACLIRRREEISDVLERADLRMYRAKRLGKNQVCTLDEEN